MLRGMRMAVCILLAMARLAVASPTLVSDETPHPGVHHQVWQDTALPARMHVVRVDLTANQITLTATKEADRGITVGAYAARVGAQIAINADSFALAGYVPHGIAIGNQVQWSNTADNPQSAVFHLRRLAVGGPERTFVGIEPPEVQINSIGDLPDGTQAAVSGRPLLVRNGQVETNFDPNDPDTIPFQAAPRSAVGVTADGNTLILVTVDGWQTGSVGMTIPELASFLRGRGASMAMALDGGGASTLWLDGLANAPSDGVQRPVANHIAIKVGQQATGEVVGLVCKNDVIACGTNTALRLTGAKVYLDDGRSMTVNSDAFFAFPGVTQRLVCVTAKKTGYLTKKRCVYLDLDAQPTYASVALTAGTDLVDAGVSDATQGVTDADDGTSGFTDGGTQMPSMHTGGCCDAGGSPAGSGLLAFGVAGLLAGRKKRSAKSHHLSTG